MLRVAHLGWWASSHLRRRVEALNRRGVECLVLTDGAPAAFPVPDGVRLEILPAGAKAEPARLADWMERRLDRFRADLVHVHSTHFPASLGFFCRTRPRLVSLWDFVHSRDDASPLFHRLILDGLRSGELTEGMSFSSPVIMDRWLAQGFPGERAFWHSWGVDLERFPADPSPAVREATARRLGLEPGRRVVFSPRTPSLQANLDLLLQALPRVAADIPLVCILTGHVLPRETLYLEPLLVDCVQRGLVRVVAPLTRMEELAALYGLADVVVSIHGNDHNPATVLEAMACGAALLVQESETVEFWVRRGQGGVVVPGRDLGALEAGLRQALALPESDRRDWARANRERIAAQADFSATLGRLEEDYHRVAGWGAAPEPEDPCFLRGLLADVCGQDALALEGYAAARPGRRFLAEAVQEKQALLQGARGAEAFHRGRGHSGVRAWAEGPRSGRPAAAAGLDYTRSPFRHDMLAGLYPLARPERVEEYIEALRLLARRFSSEELSWVGESVVWYGRRWERWPFCAALLLGCGEGGAALAGLALETAQALGPGHAAWDALLARAGRWAERPVETLFPGLAPGLAAGVRDRVRVTARAHTARNEALTS